ncbi:MAG: hypothetical protein ACQES1_01900 [Bacteroidota bacterium]
MRFFFFIAIFCLLNVSVQAQVEVGIIEPDGQKRNFNSSETIKIKNSKVVFSVPDVYGDLFDEILDEVWQVNDYMLTTKSPDKIELADKDLLFYFDIERGRNNQTFDIRCKLEMKDYNGGDFLVANFPLFQSAQLNNLLTKQPKETDLQQILYQNADFHNMSKISLSSNMQAINNLLTLGKTQWLSEEVAKTNMLKKLQDETLYIPTYCLLKPNFLSGEEERQDSVKLLKKYPYPWEIGVSEEADERFILIFAQTGAKVYISIFDNSSGQFIYQTNNNNQFFLKKSNFKSIAKSIG